MYSRLNLRAAPVVRRKAGAQRTLTVRLNYVNDRQVVLATTTTAAKRMIHTAATTAIDTSTIDNTIVDDTEQSSLEMYRKFTAEYLNATTDVALWYQVEQAIDFWNHQQSEESVRASFQLAIKATREMQLKSIFTQNNTLELLSIDALNHMVIKWLHVWRDSVDSSFRKEFGIRQVIDKIDFIHSQPSARVWSLLIYACWLEKEPALAESILVDRMFNQGYMPHLRTANQVLSAWAKVKAWERCDSLLEKYLRHGIPVNLVSYQTRLLAYANSGLAERAEQLLSELCDGMHPPPPNLPIKPDVIAFNKVLHGWANSKAPDAPERALSIIYRMYDIHDWGTLGCVPDETTLNTVLACFAKSERPDAAAKAHEFLREMKSWYADGVSSAQPNCVSYSTVIHGYCSTGKLAQAEQLFTEMYHEYQDGNRNLRANSSVLTPLLSAYAKSGENDAMDRGEEFFRLAANMYATGFLTEPPDKSVYEILLRLYVKRAAENPSSDALPRAELLLEQMKAQEGVNPDFKTYGIIIHAWLNIYGNADRAAAMLAELDERYRNGDTSCKPTVDEMHSMVKSIALADQPKLAASALMNMCDEFERGHYECKPNLHMFGIVLSAFRSRLKSNGNLNYARKAEEVYQRLAHMFDTKRLEFGPDHFCCQARLLCWSYVSDRTLAARRTYDVLSDMLVRSKKGDMETPDTSDYRTALTQQARFSLHGNAQSVFDTMWKAYKSGDQRVTPDTALFNLLLLAWSTADREKSALSRIETILTKMNELTDSGELNVRPDTSCYNCLLHCYERNWHVPPDAADKAEALLEKLKTSTYDYQEPSFITYGRVIHILVLHKQPKRAEKVLNEMYQLCLNDHFTAQQAFFEMVAEAWSRSDALDREARKAAVMNQWEELRRLGKVNDKQLRRTYTRQGQV
jgi:pentatricopeptide repeat protein